MASTNNFVPFSGNVNFVDTSSVMTIHFRTQDDSTARGLIHGFGVIMTDVEVGSKSGIRVFDKNGTFLEQKAALAAGNGESQFVSILRDQADIATVQIIMGDNSQGFGTVQDVSDGGTADLVVVDDLVFQASVTEAEYTFEVFSGVVTDNTGAADEAFGDFRRAVKATGVNSTNVNFDDADVTNHIANTGDDNTANFPQNGFVTSKALKFENEETNLFVTSDNYLDLNANHPLNFTAFSPAVQFKGIEKVTSVTFRRISSTPSFNGTDDGVDTLTAGFGAVFIDVEKANVSSLRYFDRAGGQILEQFVTAGTNNQKVFAGVIFNAAIVARVDMVMGEVPSVAQGIFGNEGVAGTANEDTNTDGTGSLDLVSVDDCEFPDPTANLNLTDAGF